MFDRKQITTGPLCIRCARPRSDGEGWEGHSPYPDGSGVQYHHVTCPERVCKVRVNRSTNSRWPDFQPCSKDGVGQDPKTGEWLCKRHLGRAEKERQQAQTFSDTRANGNHNEERAKQACEVLKDLGIDARPVYTLDVSTMRNGFPGTVAVDPADLFRVLGIAVELPEARTPWTTKG